MYQTQQCVYIIKPGSIALPSNFLLMMFNSFGPSLNDLGFVEESGVTIISGVTTFLGSTGVRLASRGGGVSGTPGVALGGGVSMSMGLKRLAW